MSPKFRSNFTTELTSSVSCRIPSDSHGRDALSLQFRKKVRCMRSDLPHEGFFSCGYNTRYELY